MISVAAPNIQTALFTGVELLHTCILGLLRCNYSMKKNGVLKGLKYANFILNLVRKNHIEYYRLKHLLHLQIT